LFHSQGAPPLSEVQPRVAALLSGRLLVGHALRNDLKALLLSHPRRLIRDTATYVPLMRAAPHVGGPTAAARRGRAAKLKDLAAAHLGLTIQSGEHSPVEDARAALLLYQRYIKEWEASLTSRGKAAAKAVKSRRSGGIAGMGTTAEAGAEAAAAEEELRGAAARKARKKERRAAVNRPRVEAPARAPGGGGGGWSAVLSRAAHGGGGGAALAAAAQQQTQTQTQQTQKPHAGGHATGGGVVAAAWRRHAATAAAVGATTAARGGGGVSRARNALQLFTSE
jgi:hypothetical protein